MLLFFIHFFREVTLEALMGHDAQRRNSSVANQRKTGRNRPGFRASTTRHTHPTCVSGVALLQVLVVAGALGGRNNVVGGLWRKHIHREGEEERVRAEVVHTFKGISVHRHPPPILQLPYITWSQSYFTVFIILYFMCFPPPQIIVFLHPPRSASDYLSPLSSSIVHNQ